MRPKSSARIIMAAFNETDERQRPCGFLAEHSDKHHAEYLHWRDAHPWDNSLTYAENMADRPDDGCDDCRAHSAAMSNAWERGKRDARSDVQKIAPEDLSAAALNAIKAWKESPSLEPGCSYVAGYAEIVVAASAKPS